MNQNNDNLGQGCAYLIGAVILVYLLIEFLEVAMRFAPFALVGYGIFELSRYDRRTGIITKWINEHLNNRKSVIELPENQEEVKALPGKTTEILDTLTNLSTEITLLRRRGEEQDAIIEQNIQQAVVQQREQVVKESKRELLNSFHDGNPNSYARSDEYEKQEFVHQVKKKEEELENREFQLSVREEVREIREEGRQDRNRFQTAMNNFIDKVIDRILQLEEKVSSISEFVKVKFAEMDARITKELAKVSETIIALHYEVKEEMSGMRLQIGQEILRVDKQAMQMVGKLQEYEANLKSFSADMRQIKLEAERYSIRAEDLLAKASNLYHRHRTDMDKIGKDIEINMQKMSLHDQSFSNKVGQAKLLMDELSLEQYHTLKQIGHERLGIGLLRSDYENRIQMDELKMQNLIAEKRRLEERINTNIRHKQDVSQLQHSVFMKDEELHYTKSRLDMVRQENALINRLSKK